MVSRQDFISGLLEPIPAAMAPLAVADMPAAGIRGLISGQSLSDALAGATADPLSVEGRVHGEDITGGGVSGTLIDMLTDPGVIAGGGLLGLGAVLSRQLAKEHGRVGLRHMLSRYGRLRPDMAGDSPQWANLTEEHLLRGLHKLGKDDIPRVSDIEKLMLKFDREFPLHGEDVDVSQVLKAGSPGAEPRFGQALERIVKELEHPGMHAVSSRGRWRPESETWKMKEMRKAPRIYATRELSSRPEFKPLKEKDWPYISEEMGRELSPEAVAAQESRIDKAATIETVRHLIADAKGGDRESLEQLLGRFGNGFGSGPEHDAIIPYHGHGAETANDVKAILSIRKEINSVLYDAGLIREPMTIHEAVLQRRPTTAQQSGAVDPEWKAPEQFRDPRLRDELGVYDPQIWAGSRSRDILEELSPLDLNVHTYEGQLPAERISSENRPDLGLMTGKRRPLGETPAGSMDATAAEEVLRRLMRE